MSHPAHLLARHRRPTSVLIRRAKYPRAATLPRHATRDRRRREHRIDDALDASFPASDPPGWTLGQRR